MDSQFYEFWGRFLINAAQGQKQVEEMADWMKKGFADTDALAALFRSCYGVHTTEGKATHDLQAWQKAIADFNRSFNQFAEQCGWVAQSEHRQVLERCEALEKMVQEQEATISRLRELLTQKGLGHTELFEHLKDSYREQAERFNAFMEGIGSAAENEPKK